MESSAVSHGIQLAMAPIFMLTAVAALIGALAARLSRIIDRGRYLEEHITAGTIPDEDEAYWELGRLRLRGLTVNCAVGLLTLCAVLIGATVMALFLGETSAPKSERFVPWSFLAGVVCFVLALLCFMTETWLAAHSLQFKKRLPRK